MRLPGFLSFALLAVFNAVLLSSCGQSGGAGQHATVHLRDGASVTGIVTTSGNEVRVVGDDNITRTVAMSQVRSIEYDASSAPAANPEPKAGDSNATPAASAKESGGAAATPEREPPHAEHYHPVESAITTKTNELPVGTSIPVRTEETIDSGKAAEGQTFAAEVTKDVLDEAGAVVIPRGSNANIVIRSASKGGKITGASDLVLDLDSVSVDGRRYELSTADVSQKGKSGLGANKRTAIYTGGGAAIGAIIGAIAGGGKGAAIGAGSGAGAGAVTQVLTKGTIKVPVETVLTFRLDKALFVRAAQ